MSNLMTDGCKSEFNWTEFCEDFDRDYAAATLQKYRIEDLPCSYEQTKVLMSKLGIARSKYIRKIKDKRNPVFKDMTDKHHPFGFIKKK